MIDIKLVREHPQSVREAMQKRNLDAAVVDELLSTDEERRKLLQKVETLKAERNNVSREIGTIQDINERQAKITLMKGVSNSISALDENIRFIEEKQKQLLLTIPNIPLPQVPFGKDESENIVLKTVGEKPTFDFKPLPHWELGEKLGILDFERGAKISGSRFYILSGLGALLERALIAFMLDLHIKQGYVEKYTPFMVKSATLIAAGQLPKFADNLYKDHEEDFYWVPTAEVPLTGLHMDETLNAEDLPLRYTAYTPCFRREKMSAGRDVRGIKRGHQFDKVEMYIYCRPEESMQEFERMVANAEETCQLLGLTYRVVQLCTGDISFNACIGYDIEVWAPGCQEWLEVSSISNVSDFQARRANIKFKDEKGRKEYVHTLNGSGLGLPRTLIAVMETYQQADGSIQIPSALWSWMSGATVIQ